MKLWRRLRLALRIASRIVSTAALRTASIAASSRVELGGKVSQGAGPRAGGRLSRVRGLGRVEPSQGLEVEPSRAWGLGRVRSGAEPGQESRCRGSGPGPGGFVLGIG